jgi:cytoskeletal protein CcmA (bactofilin family)
MKGGFVMPFAKENSLREHIGQDDISGFLAEGTEIQGEIRFKDILRIDGKVGGTIVSEGELVIGETGEVDAQVKVGTLSVSGRLTGKVHATEKVEIHAKGKVVGDLNLASPNLVIHEGGMFEGTIEMGEKGERRAENHDAEATIPNVEPFRRS